MNHAALDNALRTTTAAEASTLFRISRRTIYRWCKYMTDFGRLLGQPKAFLAQSSEDSDINFQRSLVFFAISVALVISPLWLLVYREPDANFWTFAGPHHFRDLNRNSQQNLIYFLPPAPESDSNIHANLQRLNS
jgi:helix-turn-helix protein